LSHWRAAKAGLRKTDIIVGVEGVRVRSEAQFDVLIRASHDAAMQFTVWRDGNYAKVNGTLPQRGWARAPDIPRGGGSDAVGHGGFPGVWKAPTGLLRPAGGA
jgi:hypothetical protein